MAGNRSFSSERFAALIHYVGQTPLTADRVALATILWKADFDAYAQYGASITGATYVKAQTPGQPHPPGRVGAALGFGLRWGRVRHALKRGQLSERDARWIARQWRSGVPV